MKHVLFFMHLVQDLDWVAPLLEAAKRREDLKPFVYVTDRLMRTSPRVKKTLEFLSVEYRIAPYLTTLIGVGPSLRGFDALITAAESSARPHAVAHRLTQRANRLGMDTYTLQHGIEQPGLTYFDETYTPENLRFASEHILIWGEPDKSLHPKVPDETRRRCVTVGWAKKPPVGPPALMKESLGRTVALVSENLHRTRYGDDFRARFVEGILAAAARFTEVTFIVKPHHNQRWLGIHHGGRFASFNNIILADSKDPRWEPYTADALATVADAVITTPSTVALDATLAGCPVAVVDNGRPANLYEPLSHLAHPAEWESFLRQALKPEGRRLEIQKGVLFAAKIVEGGDAVGSILDRVSSVRSVSFNPIL